MMKTCGKCFVDKAKSEFGVNNAKEDGLQGYCRDCMREYSRQRGRTKPIGWERKTADIVAYRKEYRKNNKSKVRALESAWKKAHPEWCREKGRKKYERQMKKLHGPDYVVGDQGNRKSGSPPMKFEPWRTDEEKKIAKRAGRKLQDAVKKGLVEKLPCWVCGDLDVEGHHPDYSAPLDVVWLCNAHHREVHQQFRPHTHVRKSG